MGVDKVTNEAFTKALGQIMDDLTQRMGRFKT